MKNWNALVHMSRWLLDQLSEDRVASGDADEKERAFLEQAFEACETPADWDNFLTLHGQKPEAIVLHHRWAEFLAAEAVGHSLHHV